eukprot:7994472-Pyramimonas_sp.AAC.1
MNGRASPKRHMFGASVVDGHGSLFGTHPDDCGWAIPPTHIFGGSGSVKSTRPPGLQSRVCPATAALVFKAQHPRLSSKPHVARHGAASAVSGSRPGMLRLILRAGSICQSSAWRVAEQHRVAR